MGTPLNFQLSNEQQIFIEKALQGENILVDACIGSGKTTAIQNLCNELPSKKKVLYLTYNKLLKLDAKSKIKKKNVTVTNYHGFAYAILQRSGIFVGISDLIQTVIQKKPTMEKFDVLIIDEYQDIEQELAELLQLVKDCNPNMQIIAVGDMEQKIYDKTTLNVESFMKEFLEEHLRLKFTQCFRLANDLAALLGRVWKKEIKGVNKCCKVEEMAREDIVLFLAEQNPADILCLGARTGMLSDTLNILEERYPNKFNKNTVYATISDNDSMGKTVPREDSAIFTTYDSSKGLERKICVVFDFTESYWRTRISKPQQSYIILRNIFCVAASRGKNHIIFVKPEEEAVLTEKTLSTFIPANEKFEDLDISEMFDFKYKEDVERCFSLLKTSKLEQTERSIINIKSTDGLIDLSPCIGIYQEAVFFDNYQIERDNTSYKIEISERKAFLNAVVKAVTKGVIEDYYDPDGKQLESIKNSVRKNSKRNDMDKFAVIDIETNWDDEVMSIGVVVADAETKKEIDSVYYIIEPEYRVGGMYSNELQSDKKKTRVINRRQALKEIKEWLNIYGVRKLFAYNACFDKKHLPEYSGYEWYDIMRLAAYRQYNRAILDSADCCKTGKLKRGYGVENIFRMLSKNEEYNETHNALLEAQDELKIMELLGCEIGEYDIAALGKRTLAKKLPERENIVEEEINNLNKKRKIISRIFGVRRN